jgi:hypothetical protein
MKGDFSKLRFERTKHYTSVLEQQGRVALDADRNEQRAIDEYIRNTENIDIIGPFGGPQDDAGFAISVAGSTIAIGAGRYYVKGLLCENEAAVSYDSQAFLLRPAISDADLLNELSAGDTDAIRLFLEVWQRMVTALDDSCLREPALGQADTTARLQTVWRVVAERTLVKTKNPLPVSFVPRSLVDTATLRRATTLATTLGSEASLRPVTGTSVGRPVAQPVDCCTEMYLPVKAAAAGKLSAQTTGGSSDCSCEPTPAAGYRGLENQLYRVEIHEGGTEATATFKWSRENGCVVAAVLGVSGADVLVDSVGPDANLGFQPGQWVEISDDNDLFGPVANQPGQLCQIKSVSPEHRTITMMGTLVQVDTTRNARLRRWEQFGATATDNGAALATGTWLDLENGIQVQFGAGQYQPGDHWLIPARTASGQIEWPPCGGDGAAFQPPHGNNVMRAPLACIHWDVKKEAAIVEDCRRLFPPLTDISPNASAAIHITQLNWSNDDIMTFDQLIANGLSVSVDQAVTSQVNSGNFDVALEVVYANQAEKIFAFEKLPPIVLRTEMPLDGQVTVQPTVLVWKLPFDPTDQASFRQVPMLNLINSLLLTGTSYSAFARVRVRLLGSTIFGQSGNTQLFLDGECCGAAGTRADGVTPRVDFSFPSGNLQKASDFQSWFYLAPIPQLVSLTVAPASIIFSPLAATPTPVGTVTLNYAAVIDTVVSLSVTPPPNAPAAVSVPASVTVPKGKILAQFNIQVSNTDTATAETATLAVTGYVVIP